jgi:hypothetical protein
VKKFLLTLVSLLPLNQAIADPACKIEQVENHGDYIRAGLYTVHLLGGGSPDGSTGWDTGVSVTDTSGKTCEFRDAIIGAPFYVAGDHVLYMHITTDSEDAFLDAVDLRDCSNPWSSKQNFAPPRLLKNGLGFAFGTTETDILGINCLPKSDGK